MNILHTIGCITTAIVASAVAIPIGAVCGSCFGFTGVAVLLGAAAVVAVIQ